MPITADQLFLSSFRETRQRYRVTSTIAMIAAINAKGSAMFHSRRSASAAL
jgi:hypothetical protein